MNILIIIRGRSNRGKRNRVAIRLRIGYDFTIPGEISPGRAALMTESSGFHGCQTLPLPGRKLSPGRDNTEKAERFVAYGKELVDLVAGDVDDISGVEFVFVVSEVQTRMPVQDIDAMIVCMLVK